MGDVNCIIQNLTDSGCSEEMINEFVQKYSAGNIDASLKLLESHRCCLISDVRKKQKQIDCLDYLIFCISRCHKE